MSADVHAATGAYVAGALPPDEQAVFEAHLAACAGCRGEVRALAETVARLGAAAEVPAPERMRGAVLERVRRTPQLPPVTSAPATAAPAPQRRWWRTPTAAVAAALLVLAAAEGALLVDRQRELDQQRAVLAGITAVLGDPDSRVVTTTASGGSALTVVVADGRAVVTPRGLRPLEGSRTYQLWHISDRIPRSLGVLGPLGSVAPRLVDGVRAGDAFGLTVEPARGSARPTRPPLLLVRV